MWSQDGLKMHQRLVSVSSQQKFTMSQSHCGLGYLLLVPKTLFCPNFASHSKKLTKSAVAIMAVLTQIGIGQCITY